jgi:hypothetical protein
MKLALLLVEDSSFPPCRLAVVERGQDSTGSACSCLSGIPCSRNLYHLLAISSPWVDLWLRLIVFGQPELVATGLRRPDLDNLAWCIPSECLQCSGKRVEQLTPWGPIGFVS